MYGALLLLPLGLLAFAIHGMLQTHAARHTQRASAELPPGFATAEGYCQDRGKTAWQLLTADSRWSWDPSPAAAQERVTRDCQSAFAANRPVPQMTTREADKSYVPSAATMESAARAQERDAAEERRQERETAGHLLTALCSRHIQGTYVSPEELRAFAKCFDGR
jgi:hypothetical protein